MSHQFLSTESIFEVIGNYPVVDQFDVLYAGLLTGSYTDNYITGSMLSRTKNASGVGEILISGLRGRAFSKLNKNNNTSYPSQKLPVATSYDLQTYAERSGVVRNIRLFSSAERFYDSLMPDITEFTKRLGGEIQQYADYSIGVIVVGNPGLNNGTTGQTSGFFESFPFEPKFDGVIRRKKLDSSIVATRKYGAGPLEPAVILNSVTIYELEGLADLINPVFENGYNQGIWYNHFEYIDVDTANDVISAPTTVDAGKLIFGFGDRNNKFISATSEGNGYATGSNGKPDYRLFEDGGDTGNYVGPIIRGWKYGVHDGNPHYTSCVFRRDRFGQLRDMLEQRLHPATLIDGENSPSAISLFAEEPTAMPHTNPTRNTFSQNLKNSNTQYPVTVKFVRQQINTDKEGVNTLAYPSVNPNETWSSNMSNYATSSVPYFDLDNNSLGRNRGEIPQTVLNPELVFTTV